MKTFRKMIALLMAALLAFSLCVCGSSATADATGSETPASQSTETTVVTAESGDKEAIEAALDLSSFFKKPAFFNMVLRKVCYAYLTNRESAHPGATGS